MAVSWSFTPPKVNALPLLVAAGAVAVEAAAEHLLEASQKVVPVESGRLRDSGRVTTDGMEAAVSYGREDDAEILGFDEHDRAVGSSPSAAYAQKQHEDMTLAHPNGGQAKYLEQPMHAEREAVAEILAETVRRVL